MSFKTVLVHVEGEPAPDPRLALAIDLANQFDAKLLGVGAELYRSLYAGGDFYGGAGYGAGYLIAAEMESVEAGLKRAEEKFRGAAGQVRAGSDWRARVQFPLTEIAAEARAADLVITSRNDRRGASDYNVAHPGALIMQTGRPVLVTPPGASELKVTSVVVAWKDTREGRRAVSDALPFLQRAKSVHVVEICENKAEAPATAARLADVAHHLLRHGVQATVDADIAERDAAAADQLLDLAERREADLIVAGAYGHSRFQEWVFGGFTRALLAQSTRAVLFSH
jgi:nucleotide-binding universal stress UspA family protein